MALGIREFNIPRLYSEAVRVMQIVGAKEDSRNGPVITVQEPVMLECEAPRERVLFDSARDANPFFHLMEFVWMMAGSNDAVWLSQFNKNYMSYSDDGKTVNAGYGHRWRKHFRKDQIRSAVRMLKNDPESRRVVINMWDPYTDLEADSKDLPCNTQLLFRVIRGHLEMTVVNRSNDLIWGCMGANAVHMTMLQELIAAAAGIELGCYRVFTTNLHVYPEMPRFKEILRGAQVPDDRYWKMKLKLHSLLSPFETLDDFIVDCEKMVSVGAHKGFNTRWMNRVAWPVYGLWHTRDTSNVMIESEDWEIACKEWIGRRNAKD